MRYTVDSAKCLMLSTVDIEITYSLLPISVTLDWSSAQFVRCGKNLSSDGGDSGRKKCKRGYGGASGGVWRSLRLVGVRSQESGVRLSVLCWCIWQESASVVVVLVSFDNGVWRSPNGSRVSLCKDNTAVNCITVQNKKFYSRQL
jgi:hypothetical protein